MKLNRICFFSFIIFFNLHTCFASNLSEQISKRNTVLKHIDDFFMAQSDQLVWLRQENKRNPGGQWVATYVNPKYDENDFTYHAELPTVTVYDPPPIDQEMLDETNKKIRSIDAIRINVLKLAIDGKHPHEKFNANDVWIGKYLTPTKEVAEIYFEENNQPEMQGPQ